jgi:hypothetical protein
MEIEQKHGTASSYNKGCRCEECKRGKADYRRNTPIKNHGTKWNYDKGCRCDLCRLAKNEAKRKQYGSHPKKITTNVSTNTRVCYSCHEEKDLTEFVNNKNCRAYLGHGHECRICHNKRNKARNKNTPKQRYNTYITGARIREIPFNLTFEEFESFWNKPCYYCGDAIEDGIGLDRQDAKGEYQMGNVVSCCSNCNYAKKSQTTPEFIAMCIKVAAKFNNHIVPLEGGS